MDENWKNNELREYLVKYIFLFFLSIQNNNTNIFLSIKKNQNCVCLQLFSGSVELSQFTQFYNVANFPMIYIINPQNGFPLKYNQGYLGIEELKKLVEESKEMAKNTPNLNFQNQNTSQQTNPPQQTNTSQQNNSNMDDSEDPHEKALRLIKEKKEKREQEEKAKIWENEEKRRLNGKMMRETKDTLEQIRIENERKERKEKKELEEKNRKEVLEKIQREKEIRQREYENTLSKSKENLNVKQDPVPIPSTRSSSSSDITKLSIKTPDGNILKREFNKTSPLSEVCSFIETQTGLKNGYYEISTTYPKYTFSKQDLKKTLIDLKVKKTNLFNSKIYLFLFHS